MIDETLSDEALVARIRAGAADDTRAFERIVERHQSGVAANCRYITGSDTDVPDLMQEVFVKAFFGIPGFDGRSAFRTWLNRIKVNHCLNHMQKLKGREFMDLDAAVAAGEAGMQVAAEAEHEAEAIENREAIGRVLDRMTDTLRIPLILCDMDGYAYQEIADELGIGLSAVKMRIRRARAEFRALYVEETVS